MEIRSQEESKELIQNFTKELLKLMQNKKTIDEEIKEMKNNYKEDGVPVGMVCKVINRIKASKKKSQSELVEEDIIAEWLETDKDIDNSISTLLAK